MLASELIRRGALYYGDRPAILFGEACLSFRQVALLSNRIANLMISGIGLTKGSPIALLLDNGLYSLPCDFACVNAGLTRTLLNGRLSLAEHAKMLELIAARTLIYGPTQAERAVALKAELPQLDLFG